MFAAAAVEAPWAVPLMSKQGYRLTRQEKDDIAMFSAYQSFLQGIPEEELNTTHDDYSDFQYFYINSESVPLPEDRAAAQKVLRPLIANGYPISPSKVVTNLFNAMILEEARRSFGPELSRDWGVSVPVSGRVVAPFARGGNRLLGLARRLPLTRP